MSTSTLRYYRETPLGTRFFLTLRWHLTPYLAMAEHLPGEGRVLDWGCGHGLLAMAVACQSPGRHVLGIDHDLTRVQAARRAGKSIGNLRFEQGSILEEPPGAFTGIMLIDVMHYFEPELQKKILSNAHSRLEKGGVLLVREVDPQGKGFASAFNRFYEKLATGTGFTRAQKPGLHFRTPEEWKRLMMSTGFEVEALPCSSALFADMLYVCRRA